MDEKNSKNIISQLINEGKVIKPEPKAKEFFFEKSDESLQVAQRLIQISQDKNDNLKSYMWIISAAYYSMFYSATALLAHFGHRLKIDVGIHKMTYHALVYYFHVLDKKIQKHLLESYKDVYADAEQLLQNTETKAIELLENFKFEQEKRKIFTYDMGAHAQENKAITSVKRAKEFYNNVDDILKKTKGK
ncbi:hypothetical protein HY837_01080 [archaeon]|nr:hypothetical protein [archaeon]